MNKIIKTCQAMNKIRIPYIKSRKIRRKRTKITILMLLRYWILKDYKMENNKTLKMIKRAKKFLKMITWRFKFLMKSLRMIRT